MKKFASTLTSQTSKQIQVVGKAKHSTLKITNIRNYTLSDRKIPYNISYGLGEQMIQAADQRPWYMKGGNVMPTSSKNEKSKNETIRVQNLFPSKNLHNDRIIEQLMFVP